MVCDAHPAVERGTQEGLALAGGTRDTLKDKRGGSTSASRTKGRETEQQGQGAEPDARQTSELERGWGEMEGQGFVMAPSAEPLSCLEPH